MEEFVPLPSTITIKIHTWPSFVYAVQVHRRDGEKGADTIATVDTLFPETATEIHRNEIEKRTQEAYLAGGIPYMRRAFNKNVNGFTLRSKVPYQVSCFCITKHNGDLLAYEQNLQRALRMSDCAEAVRLRVAKEAGQQADQEAEEADQKAADEAMQVELQMHEAGAQADRQAAEETQATQAASEQDDRFNEDMLFSSFIREGDFHQSKSTNSFLDACLMIREGNSHQSSSTNSLFDASLI